MFRSRRRAARDAWAGVVLSKSRNMPDGSNMYHYVEARFDDGKTSKLRIDGELWKSLSEGDRIAKEAGEDPVRLGGAER